jgi:ribosomal protein S18 acetylase RimI-like enzyme
MPEATTCKLLDWDSSFFGFRVARFTAPALSPDTAGQALDWCAEHAVSTLYYLCPAADMASRRAAEDSGFHLTDIRYTLGVTFRSSGPASAPSTGAGEIRPWQTADLPALKALAASSYRESRFYSDGFFPRDLCDRFYATWIERSCHGYDDRVWVTSNATGVTGYITGSIRDGVGHIGLLAMDERSRGLGGGFALVVHALEWFRQSGATAGQVVTQGSNVAAQRLYQRAGFVPCAMDLWYHWHPPGREPGRE